jgi:hypothetical protein
MSGGQIMLLVLSAWAAISAWQIGRKGVDAEFKRVIFIIGIIFGIGIGYLLGQWPLHDD